MQGYFIKNETTGPLDEQIQAVLDEMQRIGVTHEDYPKMLGYLERLNEMKTRGSQSPVSRDTIALIAGNLAGILLIIVYEQKHVLTSKGFSQIIRPR
jgi:hypothetical protein